MPFVGINPYPTSGFMSYFGNKPNIFFHLIGAPSLSTLVNIPLPDTSGGSLPLDCASTGSVYKRDYLNPCVCRGDSEEFRYQSSGNT